MCMSLSGMKSAGGRGGAAWDGATCTCTCAVCSESEASASASEGGGEKVKGGKDGRGLRVIGMANRGEEARDKGFESNDVGRGAAVSDGDDDDADAGPRGVMSLPLSLSLSTLSSPRSDLI